MKRRNSISIAMLVGVSPIALSACEEPKVDAAVYDSLQQCIDDPDVPREQCEQSYGEARSRHASVAPKFTSENDCQAEFGAGNCERAPYRTSSGGSIFMPLMMDYMMGSMLGGRRSVFPQPLYRTTADSRNYRTADNKKVGATRGRTRVASSAASRPSVKSSTLSRGGFDSLGRRFGTAAT